MSSFTKLNSFACDIVNIINAQLCLVRYLPFANTLHPAKICSTVSFCWSHSLHLLHLAAPLEAFHAFVLTISSSIVITEAFFFGVRFCFCQKLQLSSCFKNILLSNCFSRYWSCCFSSTPFFNLPFIALHVGIQSFSILSPSSQMQSSSKSITVPTACIDVIASSLIELISFSNSLFHAAMIHLLVGFTI